MLFRSNRQADAISRRLDYIEGDRKLSYAILKTNKDRSLSANVLEFNATMQILTDDKEEFPISQGKYQVPPKKEEECIKWHHDAPNARHPGIHKTVQLIQRKFEFLQMQQKVQEYIKKCTQCQRNKASRHAKYGKLQYTDLLDELWKEVTMDFIVKLLNSDDPTTGVTYNSILVVVD